MTSATTAPHPQPSRQRSPLFNWLFRCLFALFFLIVGVVATSIFRQEMEMRALADRHASDLARLTSMREALDSGQTQQLAKTLDREVLWRAAVLRGFYWNHPSWLNGAMSTLKNLRRSYHDRGDSLRGQLDWVPPWPVDANRAQFERSYLEPHAPAPELSISRWVTPAASAPTLMGKVVLLDFWGVWCGPCVKRLPELQALHDQFKDRGFTVLAVHSHADADKLDSFLADKHYTFPIAIDAGQTTVRYGVVAWPTLCLLDRQGCVAWSPNPILPSRQHLSAADDESELRTAIQRLLDAPPTPLSEKEPKPSQTP